MIAQQAMTIDLEIQFRQSHSAESKARMTPSSEQTPSAWQSTSGKYEFI
jgi:hypothetical protein